MQVSSTLGTPRSAARGVDIGPLDRGRAASDRARSTNALHATVTSQPLGSAGNSSSQADERPDERLLHRVLGRREVCTATDEDAQDLWDELA